MARNVEWELLGVTIAQFANAGAKPWELRLMALKGKYLRLRDIARMAAKYDRELYEKRMRGDWS